LHRAVVPALADACQLVLDDPNGGYWFAPVNRPEVKNVDGATRSHPRIEMVRAELADAIRQAIEGGRAVPIPAETVANAPDLDENRQWSSVIVIPLVARDVPLGAIVCCLQGARRQFEPADVALLENLGSRAATALDNAQLFQAIRDGERRKDEFLAMLGHELRNPLAAITNAGELTKLLDLSDSSFSETLEVIRQQASLMKRLVDDLLDVSRITSGRVQLQKSLVNVGEILAHVAESNRSSYASRRHTLHLELPESNVFLAADPFRLEQILTNLLVNAAKYTDPGGEIWFGATPSDEEVVFYVRDTGIGVGPDLLPNVFDLFAQANRSLHRAEGGLGIGLTIVRGLTELHGGRVWAESGGYGRGASFFVGLPARIGNVAKSASPSAPMLVPDGKSRRVLVVEDQPALSHVTVALLRKLGHEVRAAADGREALLAVRDFRPDVVLLDIGLPGMDGYEVARCLRMEMGDSTPVLIAMTGYSRHDVNRRSQKSEFDHHLVKPADIGELRDLLTSSK
jgi:signal transduction histidine kinase